MQNSVSEKMQNARKTSLLTGSLFISHLALLEYGCDTYTDNSEQCLEVAPDELEELTL